MNLKRNTCRLLIAFLLFVAEGCQDHQITCDTCSTYFDGFVIGFDPCTGVNNPNGGNVAFIINVTKKQDIVVSYNFPSGIYDFPPKYFQNYQYNCFFPDSARNDFPIRIKYKYSAQNEKVYPLCRGDILTGSFNQNNQITILSIIK